MGATNADAAKQASPSDHFARQSTSFLRGSYVTVDETWAQHFDPETKQRSKQWKHVTSPPPVKFRRIASAGKVMASVLWESEGVLSTWRAARLLPVSTMLN